MAHDRAPRRGLPILGATGPNVAPNTYHVSDDNCCCCKGTNWAPFLSCPCTTTKKPVVSPGPNTYSPKINKKIIGGASMLYTEPRFRGVDDFVFPVYDPYQDYSEKPAERLKGYMYHCFAPYTLYGYMPSIPDKGHLGYMICDDGKTLAKCCYSDDRAEDDCYKPEFGTFCSCYKGCFWSRSTSRRYNPVKSDIPAVGTYNIEKGKDPAEEYLNTLRHERQKNAKLLRYMDEIQAVALRNNYPAPNSYDIGNAHKCIITKKKIVPKRKILPCRKIRAKQVQSPAPNSYTDPRTALEYLVKPSCVKELNAFLVNAPRFSEKKTQSGPSPNQYHIKSFVEEAAKKISPYAVRKTAFDTSVPKKLYYLKPLGPIYIKPRRCKCSEIQPPHESSPPVPSHPTYPFSSKEERFKSPKEFYQASCATYNIASSYVYLHNQRSFRKVAKNNFLSSEKRFFKSTNFIVVEDKKYIPGPTYDLANYKPGWENNTGAFTDQGPRFRATNATSPGPLAYKLHPVIANTTSKRSYNVTLEKNYPLSNFQQYRMKLKPKVWVKTKGKISVFRKLRMKQKEEKCREVHRIQLNVDLIKPKKKKNVSRTRIPMLGFSLARVATTTSLLPSEAQIIHSKIHFE